MLSFLTALAVMVHLLPTSLARFSQDTLVPEQLLESHDRSLKQAGSGWDWESWDEWGSEFDREFEEIACPLDLDRPSVKIGNVRSDRRPLKEKLLDLKDACSAPIKTVDQVTEFCARCERPLQDFIATELNLADIGRSQFDLWDLTSPTLVRACSQKVYNFLGANGMPTDGAWDAAVMGCERYWSSPECPVRVEDLVKVPGIRSALSSCLDPDIGKRLVYPDLPRKYEMTTKDKGVFCSDCYWPYLKAMMLESASEEFWCSLKSEREYSDDGLTANEEEAYILQDRQFQACLANMETYLQYNANQVAAVGGVALESNTIPYRMDFIGAKQSLGEHCSRSQYLPETSWLDDDPKITKILNKICRN